MEIFVLNDQPSIANEFVNQLRDIHIQKDSMRFRRNLERIGELLAFEISKTMEYEQKEIETPLTKTKGGFLKQQPVLINILRAGIPFFQGFHQIFDNAQCGFIGAYRKEGKGIEGLSINMEYFTLPDLNDRTVILADPMLATGKSLVESVHQMLKVGQPKIIHIAAVIASKQGIDYIEKNIKIPCAIWVAEIDPELNENAYIVPGLGDAGDLAFGPKL